MPSQPSPAPTSDSLRPGRRSSPPPIVLSVVASAYPPSCASPGPDLATDDAHVHDDNDDAATAGHDIDIDIDQRHLLRRPTRPSVTLLSCHPDRSHP
jgi:hypothetical protein